MGLTTIKSHFYLRRGNGCFTLCDCDTDNAILPMVLPLKHGIDGTTTNIRQLQLLYSNEETFFINI